MRGIGQPQRYLVIIYTNGSLLNAANFYGRNYKSVEDNVKQMIAKIGAEITNLTYTINRVV